MKKYILLFTCVLFIFTSCKKKADIIPVPINTISATVDGANMNFNINVSAHIGANAGGPGTNATLYISGLTSGTVPSGSMSINVSSQSLNSIIKGTYTIASANNNPPVFAFLTYGYYDPASSGPDQPYFTDSKGIQPTTITITSISSTNVQGTFSGTLVYSQGGTGTKTITNGKFNVNIN
ncbi:MAG: hypothetical protein JWQ63_3554 [Mucilaginibacter sp.]|jgi:hypothetical protein|nr:hypothetical protein [Mucilaginibacter sp.]